MQKVILDSPGVNPAEQGESRQKTAFVADWTWPDSGSKLFFWSNLKKEQEYESDTETVRI